MGAFVPYLVIGAVGLIGEWLIGPPKGNKQAMPQLNQSLRGSAVYVTFGTNRVSAQVVWTANWKVTRGSGGKGGGSGGLGSAKGASGSGYTYYWDTMFSYGIVDEPSFIGRGWIGEDPIKKETIATLDAGIVGADIPLVLAAYTSVNSNVVDVQYTEAFVAPGYVTADPNLETWSYFQTQTGLACQWPSTFWMGFRALNLGGSAQIPQMSVELVPIVATTAVAGNIMMARPYSDDHFSAQVLVFANTGVDATLIDTVKGAYATSSDIDPLTPVPSLIKVTGNSAIQYLDIDYVGGTHNPGSVQANIPGYISTLTNTSKALRYNAGYLQDTAANLYHYDWDASGTSDPHRAIIEEIHGDTTAYIAHSTFLADATALGLNVSGFTYCATIFIQNTPYFYICANSTWAVNSLDLVGVCYQVNEDGSITRQGGFQRRYVELSGGHFNNDITAVGQRNDGAVIVVYAQAGDGTVNGGNDPTATWCHALPDPTTILNGITDINTTPGSGVGCQIYEVGNHFFDQSGDNRLEYLLRAGVVDTLNDGSCWVFCYIGKAEMDWQSSHMSGDTGFCQYIHDLAATYPNGAMVGWKVTGVTDYGNFNVYNDYFKNGDGSPIIPFTDVGKGVSGASTGSAYDDYYSPISAAPVAPVAALDVTPPYIINRILTSKVFGFQMDALFGFTITATTIDAASLADAIQYCEDNGIYVSVTYTSQDSVLNIINELVSLYNGYIVEHAGVIYFGVVRDTDVPFRTIDNTHLISPGPGKPPVDITKGAIQDGFNRIEFQFLDRSLEYNQNQVWVSDEVDIDFNGPRIQTYQAKFVMAASTAYQCAERALWSNLYGKDNYSFKLGVKDADLRPGRLITLVDSFDATLSGGVNAIITNWQENKRFEFDVTAVRVLTDHLKATNPVFTSTSSPGQGIGNIVSDVMPPLAMRAYELPAQFQGTQPYLYVGYNQASAIMGAKLFLSSDGATFAEDTGGDVQPFILSGIVASSLGVCEPGHIDTNVEVYMMPSSGFHVTTPTFCQTTDLEDTSTGARQNGMTGLIVGSEFIACEGATLIGQNHYIIAKAYRGWGGTPINAVSSGAYWHHHGDGMFQHPLSIGDIGKIVYYKVLPYNFAGQVCDISSVNAQTYMVKGDFWLPRAQAPIQLFANSAVAWSANSPFGGHYLTLTSGGCDIILQWPPSANHEGFGYGGFGNGGAGHFTPDTSSPTYRVDVMSSNGSKVSSFVTNTGYFDYTLVQNSADFAAFGKNLIFQVTPFNSRGDGYVSNARSLSLTW